MACAPVVNRGDAQPSLYSSLYMFSLLVNPLPSSYPRLCAGRVGLGVEYCGRSWPVGERPRTLSTAAAAAVAPEAAVATALCWTGLRPLAAKRQHSLMKRAHLLPKSNLLQRLTAILARAPSRRVQGPRMQA